MIDGFRDVVEDRVTALKILFKHEKSIFLRRNTTALKMCWFCVAGANFQFSETQELPKHHMKGLILNCICQKFTLISKGCPLVFTLFL